MSSGSSAIRSLLILLAFLVYVWFFLQQPASLPITDPQGNSVDRLTELFVMPFAMSGIFGYEHQSLGILNRIWLVLAALSWLAISYGIGNNLLPHSFRSRGRLTSLAFSTLAGLALLSTLTLGLGLVGGIENRWPMMLGVGSLGLASWLLGRRNQAGTESQAGDSRMPNLRPDSIGSLWILRLIPVLTVVLAVIYVLGASMPPWEFDVLEYHLQAPKEFYQTGQIEFNERNVYANMPLGAEMHSLAWMTILGGERGWWQGALIGKLLIAAHSLLVALLLAGFVRERLGRECAWIAAGLFLATAGNIHVSTAGLVDMSLGAYVGASIFGLTYLWPQIRTGRLSFREAFVLGLFSGGAAACKYPGWLLVAAPVFFLLIVTFVFRRRWGALARITPSFFLALALTGLPWLAKNQIFTSNPVYPIAAEQFGAPGMSETLVENWQRVHRPQPVDSHSAYSLVALLHSAKQIFLASPFLNPGIVFLASLGFVFFVGNWLRTGNTKKSLPGCSFFVAGCIWIFTVWWLVTHRIDRFWLPSLPAIAGVAAFGAAKAAQRASTALVGGIALLGISYGLLQALSGAAQNDNRFLVSLRDLEQERTAETELGFASTAAWANANLNSDDNLLCVGEARAFSFRIPVLYATCFNRQPGEEWLANKPAEVQRMALREQGVTHVLIDWAEIARYRSPGNYGFSDWPTRGEIDSMIENKVLRRLSTPFNPEAAEFLEVVAGE